MQFDSFLFLIFWLAVLALYYSIRDWRSRKLMLLIASYLFYAAWNPPFVVLLWISTNVDFCLGKLIGAAQNQPRRKALLALSLLVNLGFLGFFKYADFLNQTAAEILAWFGIGYQPQPLGIVLPIGISFYTFQSLSYTLDVYQRKIAAETSLLDFSLFVTFFPQLVAGPIVRAPQFLPQCKTPRQTAADHFVWGLTLFLFGVFAKAILADVGLAPVVDRVYADPAAFAAADAWLAVLAFSGQIFFDFAGYSLCAIGAAMTLGFSLPDNFHCPYGALGFSDFWRRWHISLSSWLRDYLYFSLGGNRVRPLRTVFNLVLVMVLGGLWHGAAWTFALWGIIHGGLLAVEHGVKHAAGFRLEGPAAKLALMLATFLLVSLTWMPFRAQGFENLAAMAAALVRSDGAAALDQSSRIAVAGIVSAMLAWHILAREIRLEQLFERFSPMVRGSVIAGLTISVVLFSNGDSRAFIYFQF
ncbi:MBOAT family O-acyltransferase [Methylomonas koyamae]|uniref:MBOAT family O-acyltransferase n=1 Tax=Methylomonas koyamae TaxID=702114 RepID=UPI0028738C42|nr:MBOAT family O-acyltransferase [Methylomonas koyamae]WNB75321.1 MBOAT family O-acyltransferase [Methylomonas koyamae]